jgi:hypothetical protein
MTPRRRTLVALCLVLAACGGPPGALTSTWLDPDGEPADRGPEGFEVRAIRGPSHCDRENVVFLTVAWPLGTTSETDPDAPPTRQYVRDPHGDLGGAGQLAGELNLDVDLPSDARDTGYHTEEGAELWFGRDEGDDAVYIVTDGAVERWPRADEELACA